MLLPATCPFVTNEAICAPGVTRILSMLAGGRKLPVFAAVLSPYCVICGDAVDALTARSSAAVLVGRTVVVDRYSDAVVRLNGRRVTESNVILCRVLDNLTLSPSFTFVTIDARVVEVTGRNVITVVDGVAFVGVRVASVSSLYSLLKK